MAQRAHCAQAEIAPDAPRLAQWLVHNPQALYRFGPRGLIRPI
jgi:hypothetical protein